MKQRFLFAAALLPATIAVLAQSQDTDSARVNVLDEIVVTGSNSAVGRNLIPYAVSVVDRASLESVGQTQLLSAISGRVPSLFVTERGIFGFGVSNGGSGHIKLRGVGGDRASAVLMMVDGQPQFAGIYSHHVADFYDKANVERVEVLRGPGSVLYGSNAMAGVINVITRQPDADGVHTTLTSQYGSYNTWLSTVTNTVRLGRFSSLLSLSYDRTDGNVDGFDFKQMSGYGKVGYQISRQWKATVDYSLMNFKGNDPIYPRLSDPESTAVYHQSITRGESSLTLSNRYGSTNGDLRLYYSYGNHFIDDPRHFHSLDDRFGVLLYQNFDPWRGAAVTVGFDFDTYSGEIPVSGGQAHQEGSLSTISRKSITEYSPYLTYSQGFYGNRIMLNGGLRMANSDKFGTHWVPQAGFVVSPCDGFSLKGSVASGYRNPSFRELYLYRMANPELKPERMTNYELSAAYKPTRWLSVDLTAYYSRGSEMIQVADNLNVNTGRFINKGVEFSATARPLSVLSLSASYSYLHTTLSDLTGAPVNQCCVGASWNAFSDFTVSANLKGVGGLFVSEGMDRQDYVLLDMKFDYEINRHVGLFLRLENITDTDYVINRGYDMPGFTALGGFKLSI